MGMANAQYLDLHGARTWNALSVSARHPLDEVAGASALPGEAPDPKYWTAYDYHMIEREARAMRRAHVYALIARWAKRLRQRMYTSTRTA